MAHRAERSDRWFGWFLWLLVAVIVIIVVGAGWWAASTDPPTATASTTAMVNADTAALAAERAEGLTCRRLVATAAATASRLDHQFHLHHGAHKAMVAGKISEAQRNRIWNATLAARAQLSPLLQESLEAVKAEGCGG